ncbi:MAG: zinc ribbon domain-containing protein [Deltaproteobacteria bacterium]|nr:zinc ribbon domain-containing protein [Deltaproteobacteria bacterium]
MPIYEYACMNCSLSESRIAGLDDHTVKCTSCGHDMERLTDGEDLFRAYWENSERTPDRNISSS